jgi:hypothetical protein
VVVLPLPTDLDEEARIVVKRVGEIGGGLELPKIAPAEKEIARVVTIFRELRGCMSIEPFARCAKTSSLRWKASW